MKVGSYIYTNSYAPADTNQLWVKPMSNGEAILYIFVDGKWTPTGGVGESAYEAAVKAGFNGSKEEWLDSLALKYSDLTAEQKADLVKDAVSAAERAAQAVENIENTINDIDVSSTDGAITALAAKQGTLENKVDVLGPKIGEPTAIPVTASNKYIMLDVGVGNTVNLTPSSSSGGFHYSVINVAEGDIIVVNGTGGSSPRLWGFIDSNNVLLSVAAASASATNLYVSAPANSAKAIVNDNSGSTSYYIDSSTKTVLLKGEIVNDFSGGATKPLSAEAGKTLKGANDAIYSEIHGNSATFTYSTAEWKPFTFEQGKKYSITNQGQSAITFSLWASTTDQSSLMSFAIGAGKTYTFTSSVNANYLRAGNATTALVKCGDSLIEYITNVDSKADSIKADVDSVDSELHGKEETIVFSSATWQPFTFENGKKYKLTNLGNSAVALSLWVNSSDSASIQRVDVTAGNSATIIAIGDANYLKAGVATTVKIKYGDSLVDDVEDLQSEFALINSKISPTYEISSLIQAGSSVRANYDFAQGAVYDIHIVTTSNGKQLILNFDTHQSYLTIPQFSGDRHIRVCLSQNASIFGVYFSSQFPTGTVTITITKIADIFSGVNYQFGVGVNCRYIAPDQDAFVIPSGEDRPQGLYDLFDALVSDYSSYIEKIDCDEIANEAEIETPEYMDGLPIFMYKFSPAFTPNTSSGVATSRSVLKVMIVGGTHPEYTAIMDLWRTMAIICADWASDANLEALRWDVEFYVMPCSGPWCLRNDSRPNYNGVDLNRNMPTSKWAEAGSGTSTYTGPTAASEYETQVLMEVFDQVKPHIFIDHHNSFTGKNMIYVTSLLQQGVDIGAAHISAMTARWKGRYPSTLPQDDTMIGFSKFTDDVGTRSGWACEQGVLGFTYESNSQIQWETGSNTAKVATTATEGFINFLLRVLKTYSERVK